jgi:ABC-2 type transport system ATP-binding protein
VSALEVTDLRVAYGALEAVRGISFTAEPGRITALVGPNGAGKTSTLEACTGVRPFTSGTIRVLGAQPGQSSSRVGTMLQAGGLYPTARPLEWLTYLARLYPDSRDPRELLDLVGIDSSSRTTARRMSGGEQQRLKFAAALLPRPELLFLDEPTAGMDPQARRSLISTIGGLRAEGVAVVLTTHLIADIEELADHVILMRDGLIEAAGTLAELRGEGESMTFDARPGLDLVSLTGALPDGYGATEIGAGRYVIDGEPTPSALACITAWLAERDEATSGIRIGRTSLEDLIIGDES